MADSFKYVSGKNFVLAGSGITATASSLTLEEFKDVRGNNLIMTDFGSIGYLSLEPGTSRFEIVSFTGVIQNSDGTATISGLTRGLGFKAPYGTVPDNQQPHSGGAIVIVSNPPQMYDKFASKDNDETIVGKWTFDVGVPTSRPNLSSDIDTGVNEDLITFGQLARTSFNGTVDASTTQKGISEEATQAEVDASTAAGGTGARLFVNPSTIRAKRYHPFAASAGGTDAYAITIAPTITAYTDGDVFIFEADVANTGAATLDVNTVGAKAINKYGSIDLATNDIKAGTIVLVVYDLDSDRFMLLNSIARPQVSQDGAEIYAASATGNDTYAITLAPALPAYLDGLVIHFKADVGNTGAATLNVNALGAVTIKKHHDQDLETGDIEANQIVSVIYNSSTAKFQMISQTAVQPIDTASITRANGITTRAGDAASGAQNIAHGLGATPTKVRIHAAKTLGGGVILGSHGNFGPNTATVFWVTDGTVAGADSTNIIVSKDNSDTTKQEAVISVDATNITLTWTKTGSPTSANINIAWEAEVESFT